MIIVVVLQQCPNCFRPLLSLVPTRPDYYQVPRWINSEVCIHLLSILLVTILFALDIFQTVVSTYNTWFMMVSGWGNPGVIFITPWSLCIAVILSGISLYIFFVRHSRRLNLEKFLPLSSSSSLTARGC